MKIVGVANARAGFPALLARASREPAVVARYGRPVGVVLGVRSGAGMEQVERAIRAFLAEMAEMDGRRGAPGDGARRP